MGKDLSLGRCFCVSVSLLGHSMTNMWCDDTVYGVILFVPPSPPPLPHVSVSTVGSLTCFLAMIGSALRALMSKRVGVNEQGMNTF